MGEILDDGEQSDSPFNLVVLLAIVRRNLWLIGGTVLLALTVAVIITALTTRRYMATASIQIEQKADRVFETEDVQASTTGDSASFLQTQVDILNSRATKLRVAQKLALLTDKRFFERMGIDRPATIATGASTRATREAVIGVLNQNFTALLPNNTRIIRLTFSSPDPVLAAQIANTFAEEFIASNLSRKYDSSSYARSFLSAQLAETKVRLEESERALNDYARSASLVSTSNAGAGAASSQQSITTNSLFQLNEAANVARTARIAAEEKWRGAAMAPLRTIPDVLLNSGYQNLVAQETAIRIRVSDERTRHLPDHPSVVQLQAQANVVSAQIDSLASSIRASIRQNYEFAQRQEQALQQQVSALSGNRLSEQDRSVRYNILAREVSTNRALYDALLQRFREVSAIAGVSSNNISVIDVAEPPTAPYSPQLVANMAIAILAGFAIAAALVFVREQLDDLVRTPEDIALKFGLPALAAIPMIRGGSPLQELHRPRSPISEAYGALIASLRYSSANGLPKTLFVTSAQPSEGKSTTSYAIACGLARVGYRTVLVDSDLRRPSLHRILNLPTAIGLSTILTRQSLIEETSVPTDHENLFFIPAGPIPPEPTDILGGAWASEVFQKLTSQFDFVVVDGPPVLGLADAPLIAAMLEGTVFVVEANRGRRGGAKNALRRLRAVHARLVGGVLTKFDPKRAGLSGQYGYYQDYYEYGPETQKAES